MLEKDGGLLDLVRNVEVNILYAINEVMLIELVTF
jgi:hypothetical protein